MAVREYRAPLTEEQNALLALSLALGKNPKEAAADAGCSLVTVYRRQNDERFSDLVREAREKIVDAGIGKLVALIEPAISTLVAVMGSGPPEQQRLAAEAVLKYVGVKGRATKDEDGAGEDGSRSTRVIPVLIDPDSGVGRKLLLGAREPVIEGEVREVG